MNPTFSIKSEEQSSLPSRLFIELGWHCIAFFTLDNARTFTSLSCYHFPLDAHREKLVNYIDSIISTDELFQQEFEKVDIVYSFGESVLVPREHYDPQTNADMLTLLYGDLQDTIIFSDFIDKYDLYNVYKVNRSLDTKLLTLFPEAGHQHAYSLLLELSKGKDDYLQCILGTTHITVLLLKKGKLQLVQTYNYKAPEDVAYHLLNVCRSFDVDVQEVTLHVSGMVERDSNLYKELYKYFLTIELATFSQDFDYIEQIKNYPPHFFSHLFEIAGCV